MKYLTKTIVTAIILLIVITVGSIIAQDNEDSDSPSPEDIVEQLVLNFNSGDYEAATELLAEDVIFTYIPVFFQSPIISREEAFVVYTQLGELNSHVEIVVQETIGEEIVIVQTRTSNDEMQAMDIEALELTEVYIVRDGLILGATSVLTPDSLEQAMMAMAAMDSE